MATLNPRSFIRKLFPTCHRILVEKAIRSHGTHALRTLVVGAGADPYRELFFSSEIYVRLDIVDQFGTVDVIGDAAAMPFKSASFDRVVAIEVMEHIEDQKKFVDELFRVLTPGGALVLTVPCMFHIHGDPYDYWRPTYWALMKLFHEFSYVHISSVGSRFHVLCDLAITGRITKYFFFPLRVINHFFCIYRGENNPEKNNAPSAYYMVAIK